MCVCVVQNIVLSSVECTNFKYSFGVKKKKNLLMLLEGCRCPLEQTLCSVTNICTSSPYSAVAFAKKHSSILTLCRDIEVKNYRSLRWLCVRHFWQKKGENPIWAVTLCSGSTNIQRLYIKRQSRVQSEEKGGLMTTAVWGIKTDFAKEECWRLCYPWV